VCPPCIAHILVQRRLRASMLRPSRRLRTNGDLKATHAGIARQLTRNSTLVCGGTSHIKPAALERGNSGYGVRISGLMARHKSADFQPIEQAFVTHLES